MATMRSTIKLFMQEVGARQGGRGGMSSTKKLNLLVKSGDMVSAAHHMRPRADLNRDRWIQSPEC